MKKTISIVIPVYNEAAGITKFLDGELAPVLSSIPYQAELILVNDGSTDRTIDRIKSCQILQQFPVKVISFSRNFGKEIALSAGLQAAKGDAVIMIDADGQHPVDAIVKMLTKWEEGYDVVTAVRGANTTKHRLASKLYYKMMRMSGNKTIIPGALDFRLMDRAVVDEFNKFTEHNRLTRGLIDWLGFKSTHINVKTKDRIDGHPTYSVGKLIALAGDSMISTSRTPLVIFGYIGIFITIASVIFGLFILIQQYILGDPLHLDWSGAVAMSVFISFLIGLVLISQSLTALYISQIHSEAKSRPLYIVDRKNSFESAPHDRQNLA